MKKPLEQDKVTDSWYTLIPKASGNAAALRDHFERLFEDTKVPDTKAQRKNDTLVIAHAKNANLKPYKMYIDIKDYGTNLQVSWNVDTEPPSWLKIRDSIMGIPVLGWLAIPWFMMTERKESMMNNLGRNDKQDLKNCVTNAHHCLLEAVEDLIKRLGQDLGKLERKSDGFLGVS